jgi:hypothetical protein
MNERKELDLVAEAIVKTLAAILFALYKLGEYFQWW